jgi:hypothetical protein
MTRATTGAQRRLQNRATQTDNQLEERQQLIFPRNNPSLKRAASPAMEEEIKAKMQNITNVISGLSYRVAVVEEKSRDHLSVQIEHTDSHEVQNVMIYAPMDPTVTIHLPQAQLLTDLYNQIAGNNILLQALQTANAGDAQTAHPKEQPPNPHPTKSRAQQRKKKVNKN